MVSFRMNYELKVMSKFHHLRDKVTRMTPRRLQMPPITELDEDVSGEAW